MTMNQMTFKALFNSVRRHQALRFRRSPMFEQGMAARIMYGIGAVFMLLYLVIFGMLLGIVANEDKEGLAVLPFVLPLLLVIDFSLRFLLQELPSMHLRPWLLLPVSRRRVVRAFLLADVCSWYNAVWLGFFIPFFVVTLVGGHPFWQGLGVVVGCQLMMMSNSLVWTTIRSLMEQRMVWFLLALPVYGLFLLPLLWGLQAYGSTMEWICRWHIMLPIAIVWTLAVLAVSTLIQQHLTLGEVQGSAKESSHVADTRWLSFADRWGVVGEYLKLEVKMVMRCKMVRNQFLMSCGLTVFFTLAVAYTPIYQSEFERNFWCFYCFLMYGLISLGKIMAAEGNYISVLFTRKEHILQLLKAKYYFNCIMLLVPFLLCLPAIVSGGFSLFMVLSYMLLVSGVVYFCLFQLAVYNKETLPLNQSLTMNRKSNSGIQIGWGMATMVLPVVIIVPAYLLAGPTTAYVLSAVIGLSLTLTSHLWLRHIYHRLMARKYTNLEGFYATRK